MALSALQIHPIVEYALQEDLAQGDITTDYLFTGSEKTKAVMVAREAMIVSGLLVAQQTFLLVDSQLCITLQAKDGQALSKGQPLMIIEGSLTAILKAERVALNFMQHLSGIATTTNQFVQAIQSTKAKVTDTRKTTPGLRLLEKQAVINGGGSPHRYNLGSAVMIKDNHLSGVSITEAVKKLREYISHTQVIEVECDTLDQVKEAVTAKADVILLDNMSNEQLKQAVRLIDDRSTIEASGGVTLNTVAEIAQTGVDYISTSKITLGAPAVDIGLDIG